MDQHNWTIALPAGYKADNAFEEFEKPCVKCGVSGPFHPVYLTVAFNDSQEVLMVGDSDGHPPYPCSSMCDHAAAFTCTYKFGGGS
jgi:hypothetical protein